MSYLQNSNMKQTINTSGKGPTAKVPLEVVKHFNWGAFFFDWIWGLCNNSYIPLISLALGIMFCIYSQIADTPTKYAHSYDSGSMNFFGIQVIIFIVLKIWYGIKGNTWAWQNKEWENSEYFHHIQKIWAMVGTGIYLGLFLIMGLIFLFFGLLFLGFRGLA